MPDIDLSFSDFERIYAELPSAPLINRFFEENPFQGKKKAAIARPGTDGVGFYGTGPFRKIISQPGLFGGSLFFVSGDTLYRREVDGTTFPITGLIRGTGEVSMCFVKGLDYERMFIADGSLLQFYNGGTQATGTIEITGGTNAVNGDTLHIGGAYYQFETPASNGTVTSGSGASSNPFKIAIGADWATTLNNLQKAISFTGTPGTTYSATIGGQSDTVTMVVNESALTVTVTSVSDTAAANLQELEDTVDSGGNIATPVSGTLSGGNNHGLSGVEIPDGLPPVFVGTLKSYVIVAIGNSDRFYWVKPAEITIGALDFATAESQPDKVVSLQILQDTAWFIGQTSTEIWYATGDVDLPFSPVPGRVYDRGAIAGSVVKIKGVLYLVDQDYMMYAIGGQAQRLSNHGIEETIRKALE